MSTFELRRYRPRRRVFGSAWGSAAWLARAVDRVLVWQERSRQRHHLQGLNDRMLRDLGLSRADVMVESSKPFWRV